MQHPRGLMLDDGRRLNVDVEYGVRAAVAREVVDRRKLNAALMRGGEVAAALVPFKVPVTRAHHPAAATGTDVCPRHVRRSVR